MNTTRACWTSPRSVALRSDATVHVWHFYYPPGDTARWQAVLCADELSRAASFHFQRDRQRYIVRRGLLRHILSAYLGIKPQNVPIAISPTGKPELPHDESSVKFNLSHSGSQFAIVVSAGRDVGIDIECGIGLDDWTSIARHFFSETEQHALRATPAQDRDELFLRLWTAKEAVLKGCGCGLLMPLSHVCMVACIAAMEQVSCCRYEMPDGQIWYLSCLPQIPHAYGALACAGEHVDDVQWFAGEAHPERIAACFA